MSSLLTRVKLQQIKKAIEETEISKKYAERLNKIKDKTVIEIK